MADKAQTPTPDELPKKAVAKKVVTSKRRYFVPAHGVSVDAESVEDAVKQAEATIKKKVGDE